MHAFHMHGYAFMHFALARMHCCMQAYEHASRELRGSRAADNAPAAMAAVLQRALEVLDERFLRSASTPLQVRGHSLSRPCDAHMAHGTSARL